MMAIFFYKRQGSMITCLLVSLSFLLASCSTVHRSVVTSATPTIPTTPAEPNAAAQVRIDEAYGKLSLSFEANHGKSDEQVKFLSRGSGYTLFLTSTEAVLVLSKPQATSQKLRSPLLHSPTEDKGGGAVLRMKLVDANLHPQILGQDELPGKSNYFIGSNPKKWHTDVPTYAKVQYRDIYPGIDLIYYGNQRQLEYDFVIAPGVDPGVIKLAVKGAQELYIDEEGNLVLHAKDGDVRLHKPVVYQEVGGGRQAIEGRFVLKGKHQLGFQVAAYDPRKSLTIDPVLSYSTYLGGTQTESFQNLPIPWVSRSNSIAVDSFSNAYVTGFTNSPDFPTTSPLQGTKPGIFDAFVAKFNPNASGAASLVYSTYLGGSQNDYAYGIAVDSSGNAILTGETNSNNFPISADASQVICKSCTTGFADAFVTKLNQAGNGLVFSTYYGGKFREAAYGIVIDSAGNAYVTGETSSPDFPVNIGPFQPGCASCDKDPAMPDAFLVKFALAQNQIGYSTFIGGGKFQDVNARGEDYGLAVAVDSAGNVYVTGTTNSSDFPGATSANKFKGVYDAFVAILSSKGGAAAFYLGGNSDDTGTGIAVDSVGNIYVTGQTFSSDFPIKSPFQSKNAGLYDVFVTKISTTGPQPAYSTYLGGRGLDRGSGIAVDSAGYIYLVGHTHSLDFPMASPIQATCGTGESAMVTTARCDSNFGDAFVTVLNPAGSALVFSTYLGGDGEDYGRSIAVAPDGNVYVKGDTSSPTSPNPLGFTIPFPTENPFQATCGGCPGLIGAEVFDAFVAKISDIYTRPDIRANGSDGPVTISTNPDSLSVTIRLSAGVNRGANADWWIVVGTPFGVFWYNGSTWTPSLSAAYQGALINLDSFEILNVTGLPVGTYIFYFGVDTTMDGSLNEPLYFDNVIVNVQ